MSKQATLSNFGKQVKIRLIELDMTQVELADMLGIKKQYLTRILSGERTGRKYLASIMEILKLDLAA